MPELNELIFTYWMWFVIAVLLTAVEMLAPGMFMIWLGAAAAVTGLLTLVWGFGWEVQLAVFAVFAVASVLSGRNYLSRNPPLSLDPGLNRRAERLIGSVARVCVAIEDGRGKVQIADSPWLAEGPDAPIGASVRILGVDGATLKVEPT